MGCRAVEEHISRLLENQMWFQQLCVTSFCSLKKTHRTEFQVTINTPFLHHNIA